MGGKGEHTHHQPSYESREQSERCLHVTNDTGINANVGFRSLEQFKQEFIG